MLHLCRPQQQESAAVPGETLIGSDKRVERIYLPGLHKSLSDVWKKQDVIVPLHRSHLPDDGTDNCFWKRRIRWNRADDLFPAAYVGRFGSCCELCTRFAVLLAEPACLVAEGEPACGDLCPALSVERKVYGWAEFGAPVEILEAEKFIQTLKEQVFWIERFDTFEQLRARVREFARDYNEHWLLERHGYRTPTEARAHLAALA